MTHNLLLLVAQLALAGAFSAAVLAPATRPESAPAPASKPAGISAIEVQRQQRLAEFERNRARWEASKIHSYKMTIVDDACFCFPPTSGPLRVSVRRGRVVAVIYEGKAGFGASPGELVDLSHGRTVEQMFEELRGYIVHANEHTALEIAYDARWGVPTLIGIDDRRAEDEQGRTVVTRFTPYNRPAR